VKAVKVSPGRVVATRAVYEWMKESPKEDAFVLGCISRHVSAEWGDISDRDKETNERELRCKGLLMSCWKYDDETRITIITDPGWDHTTVMFSEEY